MAHGTWLEVALNGPWGRDRQPGIPVRTAEIVEQGIACAKEGAAIVHVHAYDEASGRQRDDADLYARIIEGIRAKVDCIVYPTIPFGGEHTAQTRFAAIEALAQRGLLEWAVVDPGSVNIEEFVYANPYDHIQHGLALAARHRFHPGYAVYEPGFLRMGAALARAAAVPQPIYRFMFSEGFNLAFRRIRAEAYQTLLADEAPGLPDGGGLAVVSAACRVGCRTWRTCAWPEDAPWAPRAPTSRAGRAPGDQPPVGLCVSQRGVAR
jgi:hypothetical protein